MKRVHNFSAGPAALPLDVLKKAQSEFLDYKDTGASIMEMSHRGKEYVEVDAQARERLKRLLKLGDDWEVMFLTGGASTQFMQVPMNFLNKDQHADYLNTGAWSTKAIKEAKLFGGVNELYSSADTNFNRVPAAGEYTPNADAQYLHYTSNNTIFGTQFASEPESNGVPLVCDASSDFLSRPRDVERYGLIYAGAQKNLGPAGVTVVMVRNSFLEKATKTDIPTILKYNTHVNAMFNTPPTYPIYMVNLVLEWIESKGGVEYFEKLNQQKSDLLYGEIDADDFYNGTAELASRSQMNVTFRLPSEELEATFIKEATSQDLVSLKGHRSVGGIRASIYNACDLDSVEALVNFMKDFRSKNG